MGRKESNKKKNTSQVRSDGITYCLIMTGKFLNELSPK